jgi:DNA-binding XRE family transcriptional regulator
MTMTKSTKQIVAPTQILSQRELADYLGLCERSVRKLENKGVLPFIKLGKRTVYRMDSVLEALKKLEEQSTPKPTASVQNP